MVVMVTFAGVWKEVRCGRDGDGSSTVEGFGLVVVPTGADHLDDVMMMS